MPKKEKYHVEMSSSITYYVGMSAPQGPEIHFT